MTALDALIARLRARPYKFMHTVADPALMDEAADALAAQARKIGEQTAHNVTLVVQRDNNLKRAEQAEAALRQAVPREPTEAMIKAALVRVVKENGGLEWSIAEAWRAMYDAAPAAPKEGNMSNDVLRTRLQYAEAGKRSLSRSVCIACRETGLAHCGDPFNCGGMRPADDVIRELLLAARKEKP